MNNEHLKIKDLGFTVPDFVHSNITVGEVIELCDSNPTRYFQRIDDLFCSMVYPTCSKDVWEFLYRDPTDLLDPEFDQMAFNFVMCATIGWSKWIKNDVIKSSGFDRMPVSGIKDNVVRLAIH